MLDSTESLIPQSNASQKVCAFVIGLQTHSFEEILRLLHTLDLDVVGTIHSGQKKVSPATYISSGILDRAKQQIEALKEEGITVQTVVIDESLSPNQLRNAEAAIGCHVMDRPGVILEIFSKNAKSKEAKTQVEVARLEYVLPRLAHLWSHFERQRGGGSGNRGMGEKQLEVDRRLVKKRMLILKERLVEISKAREVKRKSRENLLKVALVGYTNAGKSTLLNALTTSQVHAEDKLFATLDSSVRLLTPNSHPPVVAVDTVGFISRLPTSLVASFRSTLEEVLDADLLVHVVDATSTTIKDEIQVTNEVLLELGAEKKEKIVVFNKMDLLKKMAPNMTFALNQIRILSPGASFISSLSKKEVDELREKILKKFEQKLETVDLLIPYSEGKMESRLRQYASVVKVKHMEKGTFFRVKISTSVFASLDLERYRMR